MGDGAMTVHDVAPSRPLRKDAARNRELLIESARVVFARRGLDASLDEVAHHAGLGVGTAYRHFANKYELASALMQQTIDTIVASAESAVDAADPWDGLVSFLDAALAAQTVDRGLREVLMGVHDAQKMEQVHDRLIGPMNELMLRAQRAGVVRADADTTDLGFVIGMLCTVADMAGDEAPQLWRRYLAVFMDGLRPGGTPLTTPPLGEQQFREAMATHKQRMGRSDAMATTCLIAPAIVGPHDPA
jgi:AcrR family transcriptional regulator